MLRRTHKQKQHQSQRNTLKQRGGYASAYATPDDARKTAWLTGAAGTPLVTLVTALCDAPTIQTYIEAIAKQDDLFLLAHRLAFKDLLTATGDAIDIQKLLAKDLTAYDKTTFKSYINDVYKWVAFMDPSTKAGKLSSIDTDPIEQIILYPYALTNSFISALAACFVQMKQQNIVFNGLDDATFASMKKFYAFDFNGSTQELIYKQTRKGARDGFFLGQSITEVKNLVGEAFWGAVIDKLKVPDSSLFKAKSTVRAAYAAAAGPDTAATAAADKCKDFFVQDNWDLITASLFILYKESDSWSLQTLLNAFYIDAFDATDKCSSVHVKEQLAKYAAATTTDVPPGADWDTPLASTQATLMMLLTQMDVGVMEFLLHLSQKIVEVEAVAAAAAVQAS